MRRGLTIGGSAVRFDLAAGIVAATLLFALPVYLRIYADPGWILLLRLIVLLQVIPALAIAGIARALERRTRSREAYWTVVGTLTALAVLRIVQAQYQLGLEAFPLALRLLAYAALIAGALLAFRRWGSQLLSGYAQLWPVALLMTVVMVGQLVLAPRLPGVARTGAERQDTVLIIVWDELGRDVLLKDGRVDENWFPNFRAFADESLSIRNGTTNYGYTCNAIPSLLTGATQGRYACQNGFVISSSPNLMTDLASAYEISLYEEYLFECLAPRRGFECRGTSYLASAYPHLALTELAVPRSVRFAGLGEAVGLTASPYTVGAYREFVASLTGGHARGRAYFVHLLLPHSPYVLDEEGRAHGSPDTVFTAEPERDVRTQANYVRQVRYVDRLFGELIRQLRAEGLYDRTTLIVTADTGPRTEPDPGAELGSLQQNIPLFIRAPGISPGATDIEYQHLDFRATVLDVLQLPAVATEGWSVLDPGRPVTRERTFVREDSPYPYRFDPASGRWRRDPAP